MEMAMTKDEIISSWKNAISAKKQVGILAELNACPKSEIVRILYEGGVLSGQAVYQYRKSGLLPPAAEADMTEEFEKKVAAAGVPGEDKKNRCAECLFFESGIVDIYGNMHGTCYNDRVFDVLANSPACGGFLAQKKKCVDSDEVCENCKDEICENCKDEICENCKNFRSDRTEFDEENSNGGYCYRGNEGVRRECDDTCKKFERTEDYANRKCGECACFEDCDGTDGGKSDPACRSFTERKKTEGEKTVIRVTTEKEADIGGMPKNVSAENRAALPKMPEVVREMIAEKYAELKRSMNVIEKQIDELTEDRNACLSDLEELDAFTKRWNDK